MTAFLPFAKARLIFVLLGSFPALPGESIDSRALSPDGRKLVLVRLSVDSDIWMLIAPSSETSTGNGF